MRRIKIEGEISARSYKKLVEHLKDFNRKQLWKIMDHFLFHIMEDKHVEELLQILKTFKDPSEITSQFEPSNDPMPSFRPLFNAVITAQDMEKSADKLDLLYDVNYFTYLTRDAAIENAKRLITYASDNSKDIAPHWHLVAASGGFEKLEDGEE